MRVLIAIVIVFGIAVISLVVLNHIKKIQTLDTIGQIMVTIDRSESRQPAYIAMEMKALFPSTKTRNGAILDGWHRPIRISFLESVVKIVSAGADGNFGTSDDLESSVTIDIK